MKTPSSSTLTTMTSYVHEASINGQAAEAAAEGIEILILIFAGRETNLLRCPIFLGFLITLDARLIKSLLRQLKHFAPPELHPSEKSESAV